MTESCMARYRKRHTMNWFEDFIFNSGLFKLWKIYIKVYFFLNSDQIQSYSMTLLKISPHSSWSLLRAIMTDSELSWAHRSPCWPNTLEEFFKIDVINNSLINITPTVQHRCHANIIVHPKSMFCAMISSCY